MPCEINNEFLDFHFSKEETIRYFGLDFWSLMNESCGNYDLTLSAIAFIDFILDNKINNGSICDLMCGNGRHAIGLSSLGYKLTAIDVRADVIDTVRKQIKDERIEWVVADVYEEIPDYKYDAITILTSSLGYYGVDEDKKLLKACYKRLENNGILILDLPNGEWILDNFVKKDWLQARNTYYLFQYALTNKTKYTKMTVLDGSSKHDYYMQMYLYKTAEMLTILNEVGFETVDMYGDFCFNTIEKVTNQRRIQFVAKKGR